MKKQVKISHTQAVGKSPETGYSYGLQKSLSTYLDAVVNGMSLLKKVTSVTLSLFKNMYPESHFSCY